MAFGIQERSSCPVYYFNDTQPFKSPRLARYELTGLYCQDCSSGLLSLAYCTYEKVADPAPQLRHTRMLFNIYLQIAVTLHAA
ncbi:MAG: hypothetical protein CL912_15135 [Deltaproteobacteria bacterium]|nr:hypothetical protein [Deltaproteobacteria bacterium]